MKKILNDPRDVVLEMGKGMARAHPDMLAFDPKHRFFSRKKKNPDKVHLISGGGSGHEPAHGGYVGHGLLDAAVCGEMFASPTSVQVYNAIQANPTSKGTLLVIKNYSGDRMNFESAAELAEEDDDAVEKVYVNDDVAVTDSLYTVGRRGVAGTVFVHKLAGAAAEQGRDLAGVKEVAEKTIANVRSIGLALTSCTVPAKGTPTFAIGDAELEFGVGIHGEPGIAREMMASASDLSRRMCERLLAEMTPVAGGEMAVMVNGMGGTPLSELYLFHNCVADILEKEGVKIHRAMVGNFMTSLDMAGVSVTFLRLDPELKALLDAPAQAPAWRE